MDGTPLVIPMAFARLDDSLVLHGAHKSRLMTHLASGAPVCVSVTLLDGIVLARSAMHHSFNYRSVVVFGVATEIVAPELKLRALTQLVEHVMPGRSGDTRPPNDLELKVTQLVAIPIEEASVKVRSGDPVDDPEDLELPYWAGQIPLSLRAGSPIVDTRNPPLAAVPALAKNYRRGER